MHTVPPRLEISVPVHSPLFMFSLLFLNNIKHRPVNVLVSPHVYTYDKS